MTVSIIGNKISVHPRRSRFPILAPRRTLLIFLKHLTDISSQVNQLVAKPQESSSPQRQLASLHHQLVVSRSLTGISLVCFSTLHILPDSNTNIYSKRYRRSPWDPSLPEIHWAPHPKAPLPASCPRNRTGLQVGPSLPELCHRRAPGVRRGVPCLSLWGHQPVCHPRQACHHSVQGHPARSSSARRAIHIKRWYYGVSFYLELFYALVAVDDGLWSRGNLSAWVAGKRTCSFPFWRWLGYYYLFFFLILSRTFYLIKMSFSIVAWCKCFFEITNDK